jgi:hyaluronoglucosaminidase
MVPTEYSDLKDSPYKTAIRTHLDSAVVVQWTGTDVVPPSVTNAQAQACAANFGRKVFLWDNYPVNDFGQTEGRLLLGPYRYREKGLHNNLLGNVGNPMNQAYASRIVLFGVNDFAWNDEGFDADRSWVASMRQLADGDSRTVDALLVLSDMEQAPTFGPNPWQPPSPVLAAKVAKVNGTKHEARDLRDLLTYATAIVSAPNTIRRCSALPPGFLVDVGSWLDAMTKWGTALIAAVQAQQALDRGDKSAAAAKVAVVNTNVAAAKALRVTPAVNRWGSVAPVLANGVMDKYIQLVVDRVKA